MNKYNFKVVNIVFSIILVIIFLIPRFKIVFIDSDQLIFSAIILLGYIITLKKMSFSEIIFLVFIILLTVFNKNIYYFHLLSLPLLYKIIKKDNDYVVNDKLLFICLLGVILYSLAYFGFEGRYIYTPIKDINESGFAIFLLFILIRKRNKKFGNVLLLFGLLTLSRSYLLSLICFFGLEFLKNRTKGYEKLLKLSFIKLSIITTCLLLVLANTFDYLQKHDMLVTKNSGANRYFILNDYSNYFRFIVNKNLISIYIENPRYLLSGLNSEQFIKMNVNYSVKHKIPSRAIHSHNYIFSYIQIYGIFSLLIFAFVSKIMNYIVNENNISIFLSIFLYSVFLGIGLSGYWLYLSVYTLLVYKKGELECKI